MKKGIIAFALLTFTLFGCKTTHKTNSEDMNENNAQTGIESITGVNWQLSKLAGSTIDQSNNEGEKIYFTLNNNDKTISGYSGCNTFKGTYTLEDNGRIKFSPLMSTRKACKDALVAEGELLKVFSMVDNFTVSNNMLMLNVGKRAPLAVFTKSEKKDFKDQIVGKYWKLTKLGGQEVTMAKNQEREIYFTLTADDNRVKGYAGCNPLTGNYSLEQPYGIRFSNMATTLKACMDTTINEAAFLKVFEMADNYTIKDDVLMLNVGKRAPLAVFEAVYLN